MGFTRGGNRVVVTAFICLGTGRRSRLIPVAPTPSRLPDTQGTTMPVRPLEGTGADRHRQQFTLTMEVIQVLRVCIIYFPLLFHALNQASRRSHHCPFFRSKLRFPQSPSCFSKVPAPYLLGNTTQIEPVFGRRADRSGGVSVAWVCDTTRAGWMAPQDAAII